MTILEFLLKEKANCTEYPDLKSKMLYGEMTNHGKSSIL